MSIQREGGGGGRHIAIGIDTLLSAKLMDGDAANAPKMLPGLLYFVVLPYCGEAAAWEEMAAAPQAQWVARREAASELP